MLEAEGHSRTTVAVYPLDGAPLAQFEPNGVRISRKIAAEVNCQNLLFLVKT